MSLCLAKVRHAGFLWVLQFAPPFQNWPPWYMWVLANRVHQCTMGYLLMLCGTIIFIWHRIKLVKVLLNQHFSRNYCHDFFQIDLHKQEMYGHVVHWQTWLLCTNIHFWLIEIVNPLIKITSIVLLRKTRKKYQLLPAN